MNITLIKGTPFKISVSAISLLTRSSHVNNNKNKCHCLPRSNICLTCRALPITTFPVINKIKAVAACLRTRLNWYPQEAKRRTNMLHSKLWNQGRSYHTNNGHPIDLSIYKGMQLGSDLVHNYTAGTKLVQIQNWMCVVSKKKCYSIENAQSGIHYIWDLNVHIQKTLILECSPYKINCNISSRL